MFGGCGMARKDNMLIKGGGYLIELRDDPSSLADFVPLYVATAEGVQRGRKCLTGSML